MNAFIIEAVKLIGKWVLGTGILERVKDEVDAWMDKEISGAEKKAGVLGVLKAEGLYMTNVAFDHAIQLALIWISQEEE